MSLFLHSSPLERGFSFSILTPTNMEWLPEAIWIKKEKRHWKWRCGWRGARHWPAGLSNLFVLEGAAQGFQWPQVPEALDWVRQLTPTHTVDVAFQSHLPLITGVRSDGHATAVTAQITSGNGGVSGAVTKDHAQSQLYGMTRKESLFSFRRMSSFATQMDDKRHPWLKECVCSFEMAADWDRRWKRWRLPAAGWCREGVEAPEHFYSLQPWLWELPKLLQKGRWDHFGPNGLFIR